MAIAGILEVQMMADMARISKDMNDAKRIVGDAAGGMSNSLLAIKASIEASLSPLQQLTVKVGSLESQMSRAKDAALSMGKTLLLGAAAGMGIDAIKDKIMGVINSMAALKTLSEKTGASVENLSKIGFIAKQAGSDIDSVAGALTKLSKGMAGADNETKGAGLALSYLGVSAKDAAGNLKDPSVMFTEIAKKLGGYQDGAGKAAIAQALFGKAGADMLPTLKLLAQQGEMVAKVTDDQAAAARQYVRDIAKLDVQKNMLFKTLAVALLPTMTDFVGVLIDASKETNVVNGAAKKLANDHSIADWADSGAMGIARLIDVIKVLPNLFAAVKGSVSAVLADVGFVGKASLMLNPISMAKRIGQGENPMGDIKVLLDQRNKTLADSNAAYDKLWNSEGATFEKAMAAKITARKAEQDFSINADAKDLRARASVIAAAAAAEAAKPKLNYDTSGEDKAAKVAKEKEKESEYAKLNKQIQGKIDLDTKVLALGRELTEAEGFRVKITNDMNLAKVALTATERKAIEVKLAEKEALDLLMQVQKSEFDQAKQIALERQRIRNADYDQTQQFIFGERESENARNKSMRDTLQGLADETAALSMTNAQREIAIKLREAEKLGLDKASIAYSVYAEKIRAAVVNKEAVEDGVKSQVGMWQTIEGAAKGTFLSIFDSGKNAFTRLKDTLKNGLYALLYEMTIKKWLIPVAVSVSGAGVAQQALGSNASSLNGLYGAASQAFTGASVGASTASLGAANTVGALGGDGLGALIAGNGGWAGVSAGVGALSASTTALVASNSALAGSIGLSAGEAGAAALAAGEAATGAAAVAGPLAAMGPAGWAALAAVAVFSLMNKDSKPTSSTGDSQIRFDAAGNETSRLDLNTAAFKAMASSSADAIVKGVQASYASAATALGIAASASAFAYSGNTGKGGEKPNFSLSGGAGGGYYNSGDVATSDAAMQLEMSRVLFASIQGSDLPKYLKGAFDGMAAGSMSEAQINTVIKSAQELKVFNDQLKALPFANLADLSYQATAALIAASGGLQALQTNLGNYYKDFYTNEEQRLNTIQQINEKTAGSGLDAATATRESFRKIVEAQDLTTTSGQKTYAALLTVAGAFAGITPASKEAETAIVKISDAMKRLQSDTATLQIELMRAQGNTFGANNAQYKIDTAGLTAAEKTIFDYNAGIRSQITALGAAKVAGDELIATNKAAADAALADSKAAAVAAFADLQRSIAAEKSRLTVIRDIDAEFLKSVTSVFDLLKTQVSELYKSVDSTRKMQAAQGDAFIDNALSSAKATGYLPNAKDLSEAIAAARTGIDTTQFASRFEAEKATLVMAGKLSELQTISDHQLKTADKTLQTDNEQIVKLDQTLALYQQQIDALNSVNGNVGNVNGSVLSVQAAINALTAAILAALQAQNAAKQTVAAAIPATAPPVKVAADAYVAALPSDKTFNPAAANPFTEREQQIQAIYKSVLGRIADAGGLSDFSKSSLTLDQITDALKGSAEAAARAISVAYQNAFNARVNANLGLTSTIQAFANGGDHMGGLRIVGENGPELESTGPSRIFTANQTRSMLSGDNSDMVSELRALRQEVSHLRASQDRGNEYGKIAADRLDGRQGQPFLVQVAA